MNNALDQRVVATRQKDGIRLAIVVCVVVLCVICCALMLSIPTASISADTVYQGF
jgi:hypothetical protein